MSVAGVSIGIGLGFGVKRASVARVAEVGGLLSSSRPWSVGQPLRPCTGVRAVRGDVKSPRKGIRAHPRRRARALPTLTRGPYSVHPCSCCWTSVPAGSKPPVRDTPPTSPPPPRTLSLRATKSGSPKPRLLITPVAWLGVSRASVSLRARAEPPSHEWSQRNWTRRKESRLVSRQADALSQPGYEECPRLGASSRVRVSLRAHAEPPSHEWSQRNWTCREESRVAPRQADAS